VNPKPKAILLEKKEALAAALAVTADPAMKFQLRKQIEEVNADLALLEYYPTATVGDRLPTVKIAGRPPYPGLRAFGPDDADFFFGREELTERMIEHLRTSHFLAVIGPSRSGKTSLVYAGLIPALKKGALPGSEGWSVVPVKPGRSSPLEELSARLLGAFMDHEESLVESQKELAQAMLDDPWALTTAVEKQSNRHFLFIIDPCDEIFSTSSHHEPERQNFFANLLKAISSTPDRVSLVLVLQASYYSYLASYPDLANQTATHQIYLTPLQGSDLWQVATQPAKKAGLQFEAGLVEEILKEVQGPGYAMPSLQQALLGLWEKRNGTLLTWASYWAIGKVRGAIARHADSSLEAFSERQRELARRIFLQLVQPAKPPGQTAEAPAGREDARRRVPRSELIPTINRAKETGSVMEHLIRVGLLTTDFNHSTQEVTIEIAHDALLHEWPRLREWIEKNRASLRIRDQITERAKLWRYNNASSALAHGVELTEFQRWWRDHSEEVGQSQKEYLEASVAAAQGETQGTTLYFSGVDTQGRYLTPPIDKAELARRLVATNWEAPPEQLLVQEWTEPLDPRR